MIKKRQAEIEEELNCKFIRIPIENNGWEKK